MGKHTCQALVIHCMDWRFVGATMLWLEKLGLKGQYDLIALPGAAQGLCNGKSEQMLKWIKFAVDKHGVQQVILVNHQDCGAYGGSDAFDDNNHEVNHHQGDLRSAKTTIQTDLPEIDVRLVFAHRNPESEVIEIKEVTNSSH